MRAQVAGLAGVGVLVVATFQPQTSRAGDREWSTAGKILTGIVAAQVLSGVLHGHIDTRVAVVAGPPVVVPRRPVRLVVPAPVHSYGRSLHGAKRDWARDHAVHRHAGCRRGCCVLVRVPAGPPHGHHPPLHSGTRLHRYISSHGRRPRQAHR